MSSLTDLLGDRHRFTEVERGAVGQRLTVAAEGSALSETLRDELPRVEFLEGRLDAHRFAAQLLDRGVDEATLPAFLNRRLLEHLDSGAELQQVKGFTEVIKEILEHTS